MPPKLKKDQKYLEKRRLAQKMCKRRKYIEIQNDPELLELEKEKRRNRYLKQKEKNKEKSARAIKEQRKKWKENSKRLANLYNIFRIFYRVLRFSKFI